mmetsp:Transcript_53823/g.122435  ORF Transcript_53823/g.122435 Transcript_53823/m.122435 type:complete len:569 (-) Transcript_53823:235-1941(-)
MGNRCCRPLKGDGSVEQVDQSCMGWCNFVVVDESHEMRTALPLKHTTTNTMDPAHSQKRGSLVVKDGGFSVADFVPENRGRLEDLYSIDEKVMGEGSYGTVKRCVNQATGAVRAVKTIHKNLLKERSMKQLKEEIDVMKVMDHPHILKLYESFDDRRRIYLILELCEGGELFDRIVKAKRFTERTGAILVRQMLLAINYMHQNNIIHRDLKPENFLFATHDDVEVAPLKLIDFGLSKRFTQGEALNTKAGTPYYVSPEVLQGKYSEKCDVWSVGVILYVCLSGSPPFYGRDTKAVLAAVTRANFNFEKRAWTAVSDRAKDAVSKLLSKDPNARPSASEALAFDWLKVDADSPQHGAFTDLALDNLQSFQEMNKFKKAALNVMASQLTETAIRDLQDMFKSLDDNQDGTICISELREGMDKLGMTLTDDIEQIFMDCDTDGSGRIDYSEFIAGTIDKKRYMQEDACWSAFKVFDLDNSGTIERHELAQLIGKKGGPADAFALDDAAVTELMGTVDINGDGRVDFDEFMQMMNEAAERTEHRKRGDVVLEDAEVQQVRFEGAEAQQGKCC